MLSDFFRINLPYGLVKDENGGWMAFNREYMPLGYISMPWETPRITPRYEGVTEAVLLRVAAKDDGAIRRDAKGNVCKIFLYKDDTCPMNNPDDPALWQDYWERLEILARLKTVHIYGA